MSLTKSLLFTLLLSAAAVQASTRDEERLWNPQGWPRSLHNRQQTHQPGQKSRLPAGSASATAGRLTWPTGRWCCLCRDIALTVTSLTRY